ncbi:MAG: YesL family protein [Catonella sp.]|uniref:YesL family protein n=1 Tax=Catonella sp. TaxID=2382125 RepID=UPI003F9F7BF4
MHNSSNRTENKGLLSFGGNYVNFTEKIFDMAVLNFLWLLFCLPVVTAGASTTALYYTVHKQLTENERETTKTFLRSFGANLRPSLGLWGVLAVITIIFQLNLGIVYAKMEGNIAIFLLILYGLCLLFTTGTVLYAFPALSRFDMPAGWLIKVSLYMCFHHLPRTILLVLITVMSIILVWLCFPLVLVLPALIHRLFHILIEPVLAEHTPE